MYIYGAFLSPILSLSPAPPRASSRCDRFSRSTIVPCGRLLDCNRRGLRWEEKKENECDHLLLWLNGTDVERDCCVYVSARGEKCVMKRLQDDVKGNRRRMEVNMNRWHHWWTFPCSILLLASQEHEKLQCFFIEQIFQISAELGWVTSLFLVRYD